MTNILNGGTLNRTSDTATHEKRYDRISQFSVAQRVEDTVAKATQLRNYVVDPVPAGVIQRLKLEFNRIHYFLPTLYHCFL